MRRTFFISTRCTSDKKIATFFARRETFWRENNPPIPPGEGLGPAHQAADERLHDLGQGREEEDLESVPGHAQLEHLKNPW